MQNWGSPSRALVPGLLIRHMIDKCCLELVSSFSILAKQQFSVVFFFYFFNYTCFLYHIQYSLPNWRLQRFFVLCSSWKLYALTLRFRIHFEWRFVDCISSCGFPVLMLSNCFMAVFPRWLVFEHLLKNHLATVTHFWISVPWSASSRPSINTVWLLQLHCRSSNWKAWVLSSILIIHNYFTNFKREFLCLFT